MAHPRDLDTSLWLHNKLGATNDSWLGGSICPHLNQNTLRNIHGCFLDLQPQVKLKLILSFLHIPRRNVEEWGQELQAIIDLAQADTDQWVSMLGELLKEFPESGGITTNFVDSDNAKIFQDLTSDLRRALRRDQLFTPEDWLYLNKPAIPGQLPPPIRHFAFRRKPKSAALRAELLHKSQECNNTTKKTSLTPSVPIRCRGLTKNMNDATPLKGIPRTHNNRIRSSQPTRKDGGIKLLEIAEQPLGGGKEAKRRKLMKPTEPAAASEEKKEPSKENAAVPATPDYAAGLTAQVPAPVRPDAHRLAAGFQQAQPAYVSSLPASAPMALPAVTVISPREAFPQQQVAAFPAQPQQAAQFTFNTAGGQPKKELCLTKEQMYEAQNMFKNSNKVTRPEKALILGFMAGSRENPCPHLGNIVTIKLSEDPVSITQPGSNIPQRAICEVHFQMNYETGEWKQVKKYRKMPEVQTQVLTALPVATTQPAAPLQPPTLV